MSHLNLSGAEQDKLHRTNTPGNLSSKAWSEGPPVQDRAGAVTANHRPSKMGTEAEAIPMLNNPLTNPNSTVELPRCASISQPGPTAPKSKHGFCPEKIDAFLNKLDRLPPAP